MYFKVYKFTGLQKLTGRGFAATIVVRSPRLRWREAPVWGGSILCVMWWFSAYRGKISCRCGRITFLWWKYYSCYPQALIKITTQAVSLIILSAEKSDFPFNRGRIPCQIASPGLKQHMVEEFFDTEEQSWKDYLVEHSSYCGRIP
jgi:hypothetical protein